MRIDSIMVRYLVTGIFVLIVDYTLLNLLLFIGIPLLAATSISFLSGAIVGYIFHSNWTFKYNGRGKHAIKFPQFLIVGIIGLLSTDIIMYVCTVFFLLNYNISKTIAVLASAIWAYTASRWWVFKKTRKKYPEHRHILVLSPYYSPHVGGLENHAYEFNEHMAQSKWNITVWTAKIPQTAKSFEVSKNGTVIYRYDAFEIITGFPMPAIWKSSFWKQWIKIRRASIYSHVISRTRFFPSSIVAHIIARYMNIPHVHIEHGSYYVSQNNSFINVIAYIYDIIIGRAILQWADIVVANSQATALFVSQITHNKVTPHIIYRGIEDKDIQATKIDSELKNQYSGKIIVAYAGRLISGKGVSDLMQALADCKDRRLVACWIIGDGPARSSLEAIAKKLSLSKTVRFFGICDRKRTISLLKTSDIVVNPSYTEGLPTVVVESALCKKAIIATDVGGTNEIIIHNTSGILIPPHDIAELSTALTRLMSNHQLRSQLGERAYALNKLKFSWERAVNQYEKLFS